MYGMAVTFNKKYINFIFFINHLTPPIRGAKLLLERHFILDTDYKILLSHAGKQNKLNFRQQIVFI